MPDFVDLRDRIDAICARVASGCADEGLLAEIEDVLAEGYVCALHGDRCRRRLQKRLDALVAGSDSVGVEQLREAAREQRLVSEATQELRAKLAVMRAQSAALDNGQLGLA